MEYLIDRKFWNRVIKKSSPSMALQIKKALKEKDSYVTPVLKNECVLKLPNKFIYYGFCGELLRDGNSEWKMSLLSSLSPKRNAFQKFIDFERILLETLIELEGLPLDVQYDVKGEIEYIVEQDQNLAF